MSRILRRIFPLWLALLAAPALAQGPTQQIDAALLQAKARHAPVLVDFHAPWCYSCYYMKQNVLTGHEWERVERETVVVSLDADAPEGAHWMDAWHVKALPSYVVLDEKGEELGRIIAEQTRYNFYRQLDIITARGSTLAALQAKAAKGGLPGLAAARDALKAFLARRDASTGLDWFAALPPAVRAPMAEDPKVRQTLAQLRLQKAALAKDNTACISAGEEVLKSGLGCEFPYELDTVMACAADLPQPQREKLLAGHRHAMDHLVTFGAFGSKRCADQRSIVFTAADLYESLDDKTAAAKLLDRAIADAEKKLGGDPRKDRNLADNLRVYLDRAGRTAQLDAWMLKLIAAYPGDYVYNYRHGKNLLARGQAAEALPFLERAADKAYGINRLKVAQQRAEALKALKRDDDARQVAADALKANGPWFPEEAEKLKVYL
ncbi:MAG TPA: thioredoxin family protein [Nevskiaceae bacterium]|nr:thioredoxin family protein [Nevskiaceae bacterium]